MEPVDPRMGGLLEGAGSGGPDELRSIVSRAGRRRARVAAIAAGLALGAGGGIGYGVASATGGGSAQEIVATAPVSGPVEGSSGASSVPASGALGVAGPSAAVFQPSQYKRLFTRQVGSIDIRGFLFTFPNPLPYQGAETCELGGSRFQAEVSTPNMVGIAQGFLYQESTSGPIIATQPATVGQAEGDPTLVVIADTSSNVTQVRMQFAGGSTDQMEPVQGWSALAAPFPAGISAQSNPSYGTLTAYDHAGHELARVDVQLAPKPAIPFSPGAGSSGSGSPGAGSSGAGLPGAGSSGAGLPGAGSSGAGTSGSGSSGSGSSGAGSSGSGSVHAAGGSATVGGASTPAQGSVAYPCITPGPIPTPATVPACRPLTTVSGGVNAYACPSLPPIKGTTTSPSPGSGG